MEPKKEPLNFSLTRHEVPVTIESKKYVLVDLDGKDRDVYLNKLGQRVKYVEGKTAGLKTFDCIQADLIHATLRTDDGGERTAVPIAEIQGWPSRVVTGLYKAALDLCGLDDEAEEKKKGNE